MDSACLKEDSSWFRRPGDAHSGSSIATPMAGALWENSFVTKGVAGKELRTLVVCPVRGWAIRS